jgi:hypothetical protein
VIVRAEIEDSAKEFGLYPADVERDYIFVWLLAGIYGQSQLRHKLVLKGGNCFRKAYFEHTRFSREEPGLFLKTTEIGSRKKGILTRSAGSTRRDSTSRTFTATRTQQRAVFIWM